MNIYDIAEEAGVSIATISRVINGKSVVSKKTREKVEAVLKKYNYTPDPSARGLAVKSTKSIAILADDVRDTYHGGITYAIEHEFSDLGYAVILCDTGGTEQGISVGLKRAMSRHVNAVIITGMSCEAEEVIKSASKILPVILINNLIESPNIYCVLCDEVYGMMLAVGQLAGSGRREIIFIQDSYSCVAKNLSEGFSSGMAMNDLSSDGQIFYTERGSDGGFACAETILRDGHPFNAVVCGDDSTAAGFIRCLRQNLIDVPHDVLVVGFNNTEIAECCTPALTSVDCRFENVGASAVKILKELFDGKTPEHKTVILPRLVRRESA